MFPFHPIRSAPNDNGSLTLQKMRRNVDTDDRSATNHRHAKHNGWFLIFQIVM
ncbi:hypothetical protein LC2W_2539 [Lacticaseibacillus paracasei]|uniref:Uncharacterized protein n=1 Tax=Lacticaseibacillus paracasei subsp. paracasei Lpp225 TaxID=1256225 RepID=S2NQJ7_LACPA|nr:hypothetical protein LC2W_2539 [Lacticaseibacillus paracasei]EPC18545.1 hypothetical protein Lpp226_2164 [Lacticaseibacillus paracasei subsp. paracasei Lpp226]EPC37046.1 hypothetical protein Lpp225_2070 [Lacticaseibacillus paracasei subsp. paracasei Lpp225]AEA58054.1 Hypothetical cytosolic protein [Lacticaseibacillus paracasei]OUC74441.1 hypothetical protein B4Q23_1011 [Lacticaseibacillus paracasei]